MRAKLHKAVGDDWKLLSTFGVWKGELYAEAPDRVPNKMCKGVLWIPKRDETQTVQWAQQQVPFTIAVIGSGTGAKFRPKYALLVVNLRDQSDASDQRDARQNRGKDKDNLLHRSLQDRQAHEDGNAFDVEIVTDHLTDFVPDGDVLRCEDVSVGSLRR